MQLSLRCDGLRQFFTGGRAELLLKHKSETH